MNPVIRGAKLSLDLAALQDNFQRVKSLAPDSKIMPVIKANAYGHGMLDIAKSLTAADGFAVAQLGEAIYLRENGINQPISVFQGFANQAQLTQMVQYALRPAISQLWQLQLIRDRVQTAQLDIWLKINTGMGRLGLQVEEAETAWQTLKNDAHIKQLGLMMHFANADDPAHPSNQQQLMRFNQLANKLQTQTSVSNSAAIISQLCPQQDWVRPGIMLYGASPLLNQSADSLGLQAVMSLQAELIAINQLPKGHSVGYGDAWVCPEDMPVGIVNIGYGDGYPRHAGTGTPLAVNAQQTQLIGRVSMDSIAVDLRGIRAKCGDSVELWGKQISVDEVAVSSTSIAYELLCNAGHW